MGPHEGKQHEGYGLKLSPPQSDKGLCFVPSLRGYGVMLLTLSMQLMFSCIVTLLSLKFLDRRRRFKAVVDVLDSMIRDGASLGIYVCSGCHDSSRYVSCPVK